MKNKELVIVIPAYEPNHLLVDLIFKLNQYFDDCQILVVNDGSTHADNVFTQISSHKNVTIINHEINKGKGAALKTAFKYIKEQDNKHQVIVTADADGQHKPEDIFKVASYYQQVSSGVVLGSRKFEDKVPFRSRFGNEATKFLYRLCNRKSLHDNQTGLRAFGSDLLEFMIEIPGDRYEYEMNMLMECSRQEVKINEVSIATVYINNNESSHFHPVRDFLKICRNILKYAIPSIITIIIDIMVFLLAISLLSKINMDLYIKLILACFISCSVSIVINFFINRTGMLYGNKYLFKNKKSKTKYFLISFASVMVNTLTVLGMFLLIKDLESAKFVGETNYVALILLGNYILAPKAKFN